MDCDKRACPSEHWKCADNIKCIEESRVCDGYADCKDDSDEKECALRDCATGYKKCGDGVTCKSVDVFCDRNSDCSDGSDESDCHGVSGGIDVSMSPAELHSKMR